MKKVIWIFAVVVFTQTACDLQPKILSLPDSVGEFISDRYPALLADPNVNPEIYNSAATDYGVYASPDLYGTDSSSDYVMYASVDDYIVPPQLNDVAVVDADSGAEIIASQNVDADATSDVAQSVQGVAPSTDYLLVPMYGGQAVVPDVDVITVARGDTLYQLAKKYNTSVKDLATLNQLTEPYQLRVGQKLQVAGTVQKAPVAESDVLTITKPVSGVRTATRVELTDVVVGTGDTLYSLSRQYSVPVNDLAVLNDLSAPFNLKVGQKIRVPNLAAAATVKTQSAQVVAAKTGNQKASVSATGPVAVSKVDKVVPSKTSDVAAAKKTPAGQKVVKAEPVKKISSDPSKKLPTIGARSSSKFSWPVRGKILSNYGAKSNGLFNDGINISATRGTAVKAAENGVVAYAGNEVKGMGNLIIIQHDGGWMTVYAHMDSMVVRRGVRVNVGQKIGTVGKTGKVDTPQLHFEIRKGTKAYDPSAYLKK